MAPNDIAKLLDRIPFQPLRIYLSGGERYEVFKPWHAGLSMSTMYIGIEADKDGVPSRSIYADTRHVTHIEPLAGGSGNGSNGVRT